MWSEIQRSKRNYREKQRGKRQTEKTGKDKMKEIEIEKSRDRWREIKRGNAWTRETDLAEALQLLLGAQRGDVHLVSILRLLDLQLPRPSIFSVSLTSQPARRSYTARSNTRKRGCPRYMAWCSWFEGVERATGALRLADKDGNWSRAEQGEGSQPHLDSDVLAGLLPIVDSSVRRHEGEVPPVLAGPKQSVRTGHPMKTGRRNLSPGTWKGHRRAAL